MRRHIVLFVLLLPPHALVAQWRLSLLAGSGSVVGHAQNDSDPDQPELRPDRPTSLALGIGHDIGAWRIGITGEYTTADLAETGSTTAVITLSALKAWGTSVEVARRIVGHPGAPALYGSIGAAMDRWEFVGIDGTARWRAAGQGALEADMPISSRWIALLRGELRVEPSIFNADELPDEFTKRVGLRSGLMLGVSRDW